MSVGETSGPIHPVPTQRNGYRYLFHVKHHGGDVRAARWLPSLSHDEEFAVFDGADQNEVSDERGFLYGVGARDEDGGLSFLGTWQQQIAEFPRARPDETWHGYPLYALNDEAPQNRKGEKCRPSKLVFQKLQGAGLLTVRDVRRLSRGDHA
jgi:hypothetical protein